MHERNVTASRPRRARESMAAGGSGGVAVRMTESVSHPVRMKACF